VCWLLVAERVGPAEREWHDVVHDERARVEVGQGVVDHQPADGARWLAFADGGPVPVTGCGGSVHWTPVEI
jgi:hypothetical protein